MLNKTEKFAKRKIKLKYYLIFFILSSFIMGWIGVCAWLFNKWIEASCILVAFFALRYTFIKTYHSKSAGLCTFLSIAMFWMAIPITLPTRISLFAGILIGFILCYICYIVQDYVDRKNENNALKEENAYLEEQNKVLIAKNSKNIYDMSEKEFSEFCLHKGLSDSETKIADIIMRKRLKGQDLYKAIGYSVAQTQRIRKRILEKLKDDINVI